MVAAKTCENAHPAHNRAMTLAAHEWERLVRRPRLLVAALLSVLLFFVFSAFMPGARALLLAFNGGAVVFLALMALLMLRATPQAMHRRAEIQNEGKWTILAMSLCVAATVLGALYSELHAAKVKSLFDMALASSSLLLAWLFVAVVFAQQYAHSY